MYIGPTIHPGFELMSPCRFPTSITVIPRAPVQCHK